MGWFKIIVKRDKDWIHSHPLTISISKESFYNHFKHIKDDINPSDLYTLSLYFPSKCFHVHKNQGFPEILAQFKLISQTKETKDNYPIIYVSDIFASLYGITSKQICRVQLIRKSSIGLNSVALIPLTHKEDMNHHDILKESLQKFDLLIVKDGLLLIPLSKEHIMNGNASPNGIKLHQYFIGYAILDTMPLLQGFVTNETLLYVLDHHESNQNDHSGQYHRLYNFFYDYNESTSRISSPFLNRSSLNSKYSHSPSKNPLFMSSFKLSLFDNELKSSKNNNNDLTFNVECLEIPIINLNPNPENRDYEYEVGVTLKTMRDKIGMLSGGWIEIRRQDIRRIGRLYVLDPPSQNKDPVIELFKDMNSLMPKDYKDDILYVSPTMMYYLRGSYSMEDNPTPITVTIRDISSEMEDFEMKRYDSKKLSNLFQLANEAYISRVKDPSTNLNSSCRQALRLYFSTPKICKVGDIFSVIYRKRKIGSGIQNFDFESDESDFEVDSTMSVLYQSQSDEEHDSDDDLIDYDHEIQSQYQLKSNYSTEIVYFKLEKCSVNNKEPSNQHDGLIVIDMDKTTLFQEGLSNTRVPFNIHKFMLSSADKFTYKIPQLKSSPYIPSGLEKTFNQLKSLIIPCLHPLASKMGLYVSAILHGKKSVGKRTLIYSIANHCGIHILEVSCFELIGKSEQSTEKQMKEIFDRAYDFAPCILVLNEIEAFDKVNPDADVGKDSPYSSCLKKLIFNLKNMNKTSKEPVMVIATTDQIGNVSPTIRSCFRNEIHAPVPDEKDRISILKSLFSKLSLHKDVSIQKIASKTASFLRRDLISLTEKASDFAIQRFKKEIEDNEYFNDEYVKYEREICCAGVTINASDFEKSIQSIQQSNISSLGAPKIPNVKWEDVGGLMDVKKEILDTIQLPLQHPELFANGLKQRSGILLYGPPGTGKTLMAKAVATECNMNFISVKGPELLNMYVGESEKNIRDLFQRARDAKPCIIFFDELDSLAPNRGISGDSGGVMDRIVSQLLSELSSLNEQSSLFVIGATNRPDLIDPALLVPGRFDKLIYLGLNQDENQRYQILKALTRKMILSESTDLMEIASKCPPNLTGADLYALCSDAVLIAITEQVKKYEEMDPKVIEDIKKKDLTVDVKIEQHHFLTALENITPSVSKEELERYNQLAKQYEN